MVIHRCIANSVVSVVHLKDFVAKLGISSLDRSPASSSTPSRRRLRDRQPTNGTDSTEPDLEIDIQGLFTIRYVD